MPLVVAFVLGAWRVPEPKVGDTYAMDLFLACVTFTGLVLLPAETVWCRPASTCVPCLNSTRVAFFRTHIGSKRRHSSTRFAVPFLEFA